MDLKMLDNPRVLATLFYPRAARPGSSSIANAQDGTIPVAEDVALGYRLYPHEPGAPVVVYFHGNGEVAADYDFTVTHFRRIGLSLLVVDYRGYGWSTGTPLVSTLLTDVEPVMAALPGIFAEAGLGEPPLYIMGRSLGSAPAIHAAHEYTDRFRGIIIESGFARAMNLLNRLGLPLIVTNQLPDPVGNDRKIAAIDLPLLVIHGAQDDLLPFSHGQQLYDASNAENKRLLRIEGAGHNDLMFVGITQYFEAIDQFVASTRP